MLKSALKYIGETIMSFIAAVIGAFVLLGLTWLFLNFILILIPILIFCLVIGLLTVLIQGWMEG